MAATWAAVGVGLNVLGIGMGVLGANDQNNKAEKQLKNNTNKLKNSTNLIGNHPYVSMSTQKQLSIYNVVKLKTYVNTKLNWPNNHGSIRILFVNTNTKML